MKKKKDVKKYGLMKVLGVVLLLVVVATYFIKGRQSTISYLALGDIFLNYIQSFYYFFDTAIFILVVGGFYGILNRIPAYKKLLNCIVDNVSDSSKLFVIITTVIFILLSSITGLNAILLLFIPFVISIILLLGYDKLVAISATIGGVVIGLVGEMFLTFKDSTSQYSVTFTNFERLVGLEGDWGNLVPKILLLVVSTALFVLYIMNHIKKVKLGTVDYQLTKTDNLLIETKDKTAKEVENTNTRVRVWPLVVVLVILLLVLILGYLPWSTLFGVGIFDEFHKWIIGLKIGNYEVFNNIFSKSLGAFGSWGSLGSYLVAIFVVALFSAILQLIYRLKFDDFMDGFINGAKKMIPAAMLVMLAYCVLVCVYNNGFIETIITNANKSFGDNVIVHSLISLVGAILNVDLYYITVGVFSPIVTSLGSDANLSVYAIMFQSFYGLAQLFGPTSLLLIVGLTYLEVPYKSWIKYIWRFVIELLIVILIVLMIVSLL